MEPIAVTGFAFKLPGGANDEASLWSILSEGRNVMTEYDPSRVNLESFFNKEKKRNNTLYSRGAHFLDEDPASFDAPFFLLTRDEADSMDPQQRKLLEVTYHAFENAGIPIEKFAGSDTAVYASTMANDFERMMAKDPDTNAATAIVGTAPTIVAGRLSWFFDLRGPCMHVDTACSSSLTAVDLACQSLRNKGSSMALVAGSTLILSPEVSLSESNMLFLSPDGLSKSFTSGVDGYGRGEGVVALILKRVSDAINDGDVIRAVIRGSGCNQDGRTPGIGRPSVEAQQNLIARVYRDACLDLKKTRYFEAHGTGTAVGDPIEMKAIGRVFRTSRSAHEPLYVGSLKANIGHVEASSGIASIVKCILMLERGVIPPNALFDELNPEIDAEFYNLKVPTEYTPWPSDDLRRISINSFGFGGSNAHVVLDDAKHFLESYGKVGHHRVQAPFPPRWDQTSMDRHDSLNGDEPANGVTNGHSDVLSEKPVTWTTNGPGVVPFEDHTNGSAHGRIDEPNGGLCNGHGKEQPTNGNVNGRAKEKTTNGNVNGHAVAKPLPQILCLSAKDEAALLRTADSYAAYLSTSPWSDAVQLRQLAFTLIHRRTKFPWRSFAIVGGDSEVDTAKVREEATRSDSSKLGIAYVFTGQGAQYAGMGKQLLVYQVFADTLRAIGAIYKSFGAEWDVIEEMCEGQNIHDPEFSQPLCTAIQIAMVEMLKSWNVMPLTVIGHSSGECAAAYATGALSLSSACKVAYWRGKVSGALVKRTSNPGAMLSVNLSATDVEPYISDPAFENNGLSIACINSPSNVTVSGPKHNVDLLSKRLVAANVQVFQVHTGVAYHSPAMLEVAEEYRNRLHGLEPGSCDPSKAQITMISTVTGHPESHQRISSAQYWVDNLVSPVRFADAVEKMATSQSGPARTLGMLQLRPVFDVIEIGPHSALRYPVTTTLKGLDKQKGSGIRYWSVLDRARPQIEVSMQIPARLFARGYPVDIGAVNAATPGEAQPPLLCDTPAYPFNHDQRYWKESRISRDWRRRGGGPANGILGVRVSDWNPLEPRWRKFVSLEETPWVADHVISGTPLFPASGMLLMALAAVEANLEIQGSTVGPASQISGFHIRDATFSSPIIVRSRVELQTHLRSAKKVNEKSVTWFEVQIFMYTGTDNDTDQGRWVECFKANIQIRYLLATNGLEQGLEARLMSEKAREDVMAAKAMCSRRISKGSFYAYHKAHGLVYGPRFQLVDDVHWDGGYTSTAIVRDAAQDCPFGTFIHPATLDAAFQTCMTAVWSEALSKNAPTMVPHKMFDVFVSAMPWLQKTESPLQVMTSPSDLGQKGTACRVRILRDDGQLLCDLKQLEISAVGGGTADNESAQKKIIYGIKWQPLLEMMEPGQVSEMCEKHAGSHQSSLPQNDMVDFYTRLENALVDVIEHTLSKMRPEDVDAMPLHLQYYVSWMKLQLQRHRGEQEAMTYDLRPTITDAAWEELVALKPSWKLFTTVARNLEAILRGEVDPLSYMFSTGEAEEFYADVCSHICAKVEPFFALAAHQNPTQSILEVGAGTGGMTTNILSMFRAQEQLTGAPAFTRYTYTDISSAFFEAAQARFEHFASSGRFVFQTFDLDRDSSAQGFDAGQYDMIIAGSVIHATSSIAATLSNLRRLLKPGGKLILLEITAPEKIVGSFVFGTLPGWWRGEEARLASSPAVNEATWDRFLKDTGFTGNEVIVQDWNDERCHDFSLIVTTVQKAEELAPSQQDRIVLVTSGTPFQQNLADQLLGVIKNGSSYRHALMPIQEASSVDISSDDLVVFLLDSELAFMSDVDEENFVRIKEFFARSKRLLWVATADPANEVYAADHVSVGLLRSLRSEDVGKQIVSLIVEGLSTPESMATEISKVFEASFRQQSSELEYVLRNGTLCVPRLVYSQQLDKSVRSALQPRMRAEAWGTGPSVKLSVGVPGDLDSLRYSDDSETSTELGPHQVEIEAKAWGLSFRDIFLALGRLKEADGFGFECAGHVIRVGDQCKSLVPGDRVCMTARGSMRKYPRADEREVHRIPQDMSFESAASMVGPALTAVYSLIEVARLRRGERILIHSAAGATGQLAVMLAQSMGAEVYCTVGNEEKKQHMMASFAIPSERIFDSRDTSFAEGIHRLTDGYGVDVLLNSLSGDKLLAGWGCMAPYGRFIEIGKSDIMANEALPMSGFKRNITFAAIDFYHTTEHRKDITQEMLAKAMLLVRGQVFRAPQPVRLFRTSQVEEAFRYLQSGQHAGRVVIVPEDDDVVSKFLVEKPAWHFASDASYLVVGGFGGLGRAVLLWMAGKGAKHIMVLSRSGDKASAAKDVVAQLNGQGVQVCTLRCDASSRTDLAAAMKEAEGCMPPIRGCINAAMLLQDTFFPKMTRQQWLGTVDSKLKSSTNLSELLPDNLDFFILFSSLSGVYGTPGQSNYAAGCTSQDALARARVLRGLKATSIDIGWMRTIGVVAESELYQRVREREADMQQIEEDEFLALLDICCDPSRDVANPDDSQVLLGPVTPAHIRMQGEEPPPILLRPLFMGFDELPTSDLAMAQNQQSQLTPAARFKNAGTSEERVEVVMESLVTKIARALAIAISDIDTTKPLFEYGVDSLVALELRNWLVKEFESDIAVFDMMGGISIAGIGALVVERGESNAV